MTLSASTSGLRRLFRATFSPSLKNLSVCATRNSSSIPQIEGIDNSNLPPLATPKLFISGLSRITTDEKLKEAFSRYGQLLEAKVITDRVSGRSKGFGFVKYSTIEEAEEARKGMNGHFLDGWVIFVDPAKSRAQKATAKQPETCSSQSGVKANKTVGWCG
ncbi:RNA binding protein [Rhynchospora pubera]|uniref:RNA binding protein n=1 Tax=Rhynchospora pubera TaxID=906938 RepID=A0AAV8D842_9POAL|nr:RNA binding protein [Rhynchospora pubera]